MNIVLGHDTALQGIFGRDILGLRDEFFKKIIMPLVQDRSLTNSPARYHCAMDVPPGTKQITRHVYVDWFFGHTMS